ncbi:MAG TPA: CsbD family protein [Chloroflexota bacterium]|nr:CsbD family protein [Chloroflexota bacterium]
MAGVSDKIEGKAKEVKGAATGDKKTEMEGKAQGAKGNVKDAVDKATR